MAVPPGSSPSKISPLARAMSSIVSKNSWCAGAMVVTIATCGRTRPVSADSSPAWFIPISSTASVLSAGIRASDSGTPVWLL